MNGDRVIRSDVLVSSVRFLSGNRLAGTCADGAVRIWDASSGEVKKIVPHDPGDRAPLLIESTGACAAVGADGAVKIRDLGTAAIVRRQNGPKAKIKMLAVSRDGGMTAAAGPAADRASENVVRVWDLSGKERFVAPAGLGGTSAMTISPDGATLVAASFDTDLRAWSCINGQMIACIEDLPLSTFALAFSPDGKALAAAGVDSVVRLFDTRTWKPIRTLSGQPEMIVSLAFSSDGRMLATGGFSELGMKRPAHVVLWDVASGRAIRRVPTPHFVTSVAFSEDGEMLASVSADNAIHLWAARGA